jgi:hypothetical protein
VETVGLTGDSDGETEAAAAPDEGLFVLDEVKN